MSQGYGYNHRRNWMPTIMKGADVVWQVGPKGGVKIIRHNWSQNKKIGYITNDAEEMKEFMWIKLVAKPLTV